MNNPWLEVQVFSAAYQKYQGFNHLWYFFVASAFGIKKVLTSAQNLCASLHFYFLQDTLPIINDYGVI
ncbi:hypothetical protein [Bacillus subtilis]|uniref:hypothetical protein n=1 Tax=Bacillus subtilis TaxID=1423 RepID=UPI001062FDC9|nr:hypothetical protein [Bacillus subtilis]TDU13625.1 hypothetical protein DFO78_10350 [Bacillus subtilis]